nr:hypothetical protein [Myxococcales bacterium]
RQIDWDAAVWTTTDVDGLWFAQLALTWRPRSTPAAGFSDPGSVFVVDGDVFVDDGTPSAAWQSRAHRSAVRLRQSAASDVVALYRDRVRVAARVVRDRPLRQRVAHALRIAELDARLDALTGAAVSRWQAGDPALR